MLPPLQLPQLLAANPVAAVADAAVFPAWVIRMLFLELWLLCPVVARLISREAIRTNFKGYMPPRAVTIAELAAAASRPAAATFVTPP